MPVPDNDPHALTVRSSTQPWGCFNRDIRHGYFAPNRAYRDNGTFIQHIKYITHTMSKECRHGSSLTDSRCAGCKWQGFGERYVEMIEQKSQM